MRICFKGNIYKKGILCDSSGRQKQLPLNRASAEPYRLSLCGMAPTVSGIAPPQRIHCMICIYTSPLSPSKDHALSLPFSLLPSASPGALSYQVSFFCCQLRLQLLTILLSSQRNHSIRRLHLSRLRLMSSMLLPTHSAQIPRLQGTYAGGRGHYSHWWTMAQ